MSSLEDQVTSLTGELESVNQTVHRLETELGNKNNENDSNIEEVSSFRDRLAYSQSLCIRYIPSNTKLDCVYMYSIRNYIKIFSTMSNQPLIQKGPEIIMRYHL